MNRIKIGVSATAIALLMTAGHAAAQDWQGPYIGGFAGYSKLNGAGDERLEFDTNLDGVFGDTVRTGAGADAFSPGFCDGMPNGNNAAAGCSSDNDDGGEFGLRAGYDWQVGSWVFGVVGDVSILEGKDAATGFSVTPANYFFQRDIDHLAAARVRVGYAGGRFLPYVTGGYANANVASTFGSSNTANSFSPAKRDDRADGYQIGAGVETRVMDNISVGVEYMYTRLDMDSHVVRVGPGTAPATNPFLLVNPNGTDLRRSDDRISLHNVRLTAAVRF